MLRHRRTQARALRGVFGQHRAHAERRQHSTDHARERRPFGAGLDQQARPRSVDGHHHASSPARDGQGAGTAGTGPQRARLIQARHPAEFPARHAAARFPSRHTRVDALAGVAFPPGYPPISPLLPVQSAESRVVPVVGQLRAQPHADVASGSRRQCHSRVSP